MPSSTPKQARFMRAIEHGFKPDRVKAPPMSVAKEFVAADKKAHKGKMESMRGRAKTSSEKRFDKAKPY